MEREKARERYWARTGSRCGLTCAGSWPSCLRQGQFSTRSLPGHGLDVCLPVPPSLCPSVRQCARSSQLGHRPSARGGGGAWMTSALPRPPLKPSERAPPRQALRSARGRALIPHVHPITSLTLLSLGPEGCALPRLSSRIQGATWSPGSSQGDIVS